jgi:hypothetical protein
MLNRVAILEPGYLPRFVGAESTALEIRSVPSLLMVAHAYPLKVC